MAMFSFFLINNGVWKFMSERIQKILSQWGVASRRHAEELILQGRVCLNDTVVKLGDKADPIDRSCLSWSHTQKSVKLDKGKKRVGYITVIRPSKS